MKKLVIFLIIISILISCNKQETKQQFLIIGKIRSIDNTQVYLKRYNGDGFQTTDSTFIVEGEFKFIGKVDLPELYRITIKEQDEYIPLFIENSPITITADTGKLFYAEVAGSRNDSIYKRFCRAIDSIDVSMNAVIEEYKLAEISNNTKKAKVLQSILDSIYKKQVKYTAQFVEKNNSSAVAVFILYKYLSGEMNRNELLSLSVKIDTSLKGSVYSRCFEKQIDIMKRTEIGEKATDFSLPDTSGTSFKLSSFSGKYVLIDFWASWCPGCRDENSEIVKVYKKYYNKGFVVLGVSLDSKHDKWLKAIHDDHLNWTHISDLRGWDNAVASMYGVRSIPSNLLIGPDGKIIAKNIHGQDMFKKLEEIIK